LTENSQNELGYWLDAERNNLKVETKTKHFVFVVADEY